VSYQDPIWFVVCVAMMAAPFVAWPIIALLEWLGIGGQR
jgi:hypothetical protein